MNYPKNELAQLVLAYCTAYQIEDVVISPGSRNAPLTIGFTHHPNVKTYSIADERCAAFFAMGIAQQKGKPVAVVCTSGTALLNYYPAFAEAFYSDIPLVVISADRPKHLIDIGDGQTIRQDNVFERHSLFNASLVLDIDSGKSNAELLQKALDTAITHNGPVHINVPFDEPLYETVEKLSYEIVPEKRTNKEVEIVGLKDFASVWNTSKRKMILVGTHDDDDELQLLLNHFANDNSVIVLTETTSNLHHQNFVNSIDKIIMPLDPDEFNKLRPEVLLTFGGMVISKRIKQLLRRFQPMHHVHLHPEKSLDTFHCLKHHFKVKSIDFFKSFNPLSRTIYSQYQQQWLNLKKYRSEQHKKYLTESDFSDLIVFDTILNTIPDNSQLQLGNSSIVRYAQLFDLNTTLKVFCNRGTSGIDGSTSTAIGASLPVREQTVFITGDISFFYDSNALWNDYIRNDFRIILINNSGGGIFRIIPGPQSTNSLDYFESPHELNAKYLCKMFGFEYLHASNEVELSQKLIGFYDSGQYPKLLEIQTPRQENDRILMSYFDALR